MSNVTVFERLIHPHSTSDFFEKYYEKKHLVIKRKNKEYYTDILNNENLDIFFQNRAIPSTQISLVKSGETINPKKWGINTGIGYLVNLDKLFDFFLNGATIVINAAEQSIPSLTSYNAALEQEFGFRFQCNLYLTPGNDSQGFDLHHDSHDVIILQTSGTKLWRIYDSPIKLPTDKWPHADYEEGKIGDPADEFELEQGDLLYIPRGIVHCALTTSETSVHVTSGLYPVCLYELLKVLVRYAEDKPKFRSSVPFKFSDQQPCERDELEKFFKDEMHTMIDKISVNDLFDIRFKHFLSNYSPPPIKGRFSSSISLEYINLNTKISQDKPMIIKIEELKKEKKIRVFSKSKEFKFPVFMRAPIESLFACNEFLVQDINGLITDSGKIELAKKFVREGMLSIKQD